MRFIYFVYLILTQRQGTVRGTEEGTPQVKMQVIGFTFLFNYCRIVFLLKQTTKTLNI